MKIQRKSWLIILGVFVLVLAAFAPYLSSTYLKGSFTFNDLNSYQKQKYWQYMQDCQALLSNKQYTQYQACALNVLQKASVTQQQVAAYCIDGDGINYLKKGSVISDLYPFGKADYSQAFPNGITYVMEGACSSDNRYMTYQKNCKELGKNYVAVDGSCKSTSSSAPLPIEKLCYGGPGVQKTREVSFINTPDLDVILSLGFPDSATKDQSAAVQRGAYNAKIILSLLDSYFAPYPCDTLYLDSYLNEATGGPGQVHIGGSDPANGILAIDSAHLLSHELTHSYFHSSGFKSWMAEGMAQFMPTILIYDSVNSGNPMFNGFNKMSNVMNGIPSTEEDLKKDIQKNVIDVSNSVLSSNGVSPDSPICKYDTDYAKGSDLGRAFFANVYLQIGRDNFFKALQSLYSLYRTTGNQLTYNDIYKGILANTPAAAMSGTKMYIKSKLCIP